MTTNLAIMLNNAAAVARAAYAEHALTTVTYQQAIMLEAIRTEPSIRQTDLVKATGTDRSTLSAMLRRMKERGWITLEEDAQDGRVVRVSLTHSGANMATRSAKALELADVRIYSRIATKDNIAVFKQCLTGMVK